MNKREIAELVGIAAVIASLLFLAYEIRQSNQIARSTVTFELANNASAIHEIIWTNPEIAALHVRIGDPAYSPTAAERETLRAEAQRHMNLWGAVEVAYRNGHQTREQLDIMLDDVEAVVSRYPAMRVVWQSELGRFPGLRAFEFHARATAAIDPAQRTDK